jgi:asparagine synthase (glutamine-hydrolysing)
MCGIAGFTGPASDRRALLSALSAAIVHRGPDEEGEFFDDDAALAIRRLSIIDVADGHQPYSNETGSIRVVFNGEIYGYRDLRERLLHAGHRFASNADGEVIAHAYEEFGERFLERLDGMFAIALWDAGRRRLVLARDRLGKKPLFYSVREHGLTFASEMAAVLLDERIPREVDDDALADYLRFGYVPSPRTILTTVRKLEPGTSLTWTADDGAITNRYWTLDYEPKGSISYEDALDEFERRSLASVKARLMSEVPLGVFLSGGIDSSYVLAQMVAAGAPAIETFSIGFPDSRYDERSHARQIAERLGSTHHEAIVEPTDLLEVLPLLVHHYGEPFADSSAVPTYYVARMARERITVALTGEGGDELLGGYYRHQAARGAAYLDRAPRALKRMAGGASSRLRSEVAHPMSTRHRLYRFLRAFELDPGERYAEFTAAMRPADRAAVSPRFDHAAALRAPGRADNALDRALAVDTARSLPDQLLVKMDIASMANSLEARAPLLDYRLVEWVARLPVAYKQRGRARKRLLSDALARHLPPELFKRPKMGFAAPIPGWLRSELSELVSDTLLGSASRDRGIVDTGSIESLIRRHNAGEEHTRALWTLLMLELWYQQFIDRTPVAAQ